ncbi:MAG: hypothetical protein E6G62_00250 [Actinobacteria bacterium]|nr:MAG: hypothetical protein E6G62_00250 [Actinomycetota bacterium]
MSGFERVGGERCGDAAPAERQPRSDHRHDGRRTTQGAQQVWEQAGHAEADEHEGDRQPAGVAGGVRRREQGGTHHPDHDRPDGEMLVASAMLAEQALGEEHQHQQARGERGLDDDERREHQRDDLKRPAEHRETRSGEPACPPGKTPCERQPQMLLVWGLLGVQRLQGDP